MKKSLVSAGIAALCMVGVSVCSPVFANASSEEVEITGSVEEQEALQETAESYVEMWNSNDWGLFIEEYAEQMSEEDLAIYTEWDGLQDNAGAYVGILSEDYTENENEIIATIVADYEQKDLQYKFTFNENAQMTDAEVIEFEEDEGNMQDKLMKAGINTIMSITIVFAVLFFIMLIISAFKFIPMLFGTEKKQEKKEIAPIPVSQPEVVEDVTDVTDDTELVAVITAAIMASMGSEAPADGLRISSIKRRTGSKWKKQ